MVGYSPEIIASEKKATTTTTTCFVSLSTRSSPERGWRRQIVQEDNGQRGILYPRLCCHLHDHRYKVGSDACSQTPLLFVEGRVTKISHKPPHV